MTYIFCCLLHKAWLCLEASVCFIFSFYHRQTRMGPKVRDISRAKLAIVLNERTSKACLCSVTRMEFINLELYPLDKIGDKSYKDCVSDLRSKLVNKGVATCPGFLKDEAIKEAVEDINKVKSKAWKTDTSHNIYLDNGDSDYSADHIRNKLLPTTVNISGFKTSLNVIVYFTTKEELKVLIALV